MARCPNESWCLGMSDLEASPVHPGCPPYPPRSRKNELRTFTSYKLHHLLPAYCSGLSLLFSSRSPLAWSLLSLPEPWGGSHPCLQPSPPQPPSGPLPFQDPESKSCWPGQIPAPELHNPPLLDTHPQSEIPFPSVLPWVGGSRLALSLIAPIHR